MAQIPPEVQKAILGNAGSLIAFAVGAEDANVIHKEYAEVFSQNDLVNLRNYQIAIKLMIDGHSTRPFLANTLPLPISRNQNRPKVIAVSRERYARKAKTLRPPSPKPKPEKEVEHRPRYDKTQRARQPKKSFQRPSNKPHRSPRPASGTVFEGKRD